MARVAQGADRGARRGPNLVKALERELRGARARPAPAPYDASQLRLGDEAASRRACCRATESVWLDTAPPPRAAPRPPARRRRHADPRTWTEQWTPRAAAPPRDASGSSVGAQRRRRPSRRSRTAANRGQGGSARPASES